jgi:plastocyanin
MDTNNRRPDGWTSADAAGLAIFPGLVRYDEAWNPAVGEIGHAFRVTVRGSNGYVYPASHRAGTTAGALPLGARLRLKKNVGGLDPALRSSDPNVQKIFRAMQKHGLIVADNGSDMYITGTFDTRWNNGILNPAFAALTASDFEVIQLGWVPAATPPPPPPAVALTGVSANPASIVGGAWASGTVSLSAAAPSGGAGVALASASSAISVPASVSVPAGATSATFAIGTTPVTMTTASTLSASYNGTTRTTTFTVNPAPATAAALTSLALSPTSVVGGSTAVATVKLTAPAPAGGARMTLSTSDKSIAFVPASVQIAAGATTATFAVTTKATRRLRAATIAASYAGVVRTVTISVRVR